MSLLLKGITNPAAILIVLFAFSWFGIAGGSTKGNGWQFEDCSGSLSL